MMQNVCADVTPPLPPRGRFITRGTIASCPNISVDREKVGVVYYWTGWCIDRPGSRPDFGGLAALLSSLSFPQHQSRWLQLPADQRCNGLVSRRKARGRATARKTRHAEKSGILVCERSKIDRRDAVMSDLPKGWRRNLYPVRAHWRFETRNKRKCCFLLSAWFLYFRYLVITGRTGPFGGFVAGFILYSANRPSLKKTKKWYKHNRKGAVSIYSELEYSWGI